MQKLLPYILFGIQEKYDKKRRELADMKKGRLEKIVKSTAYTIQEGAEFTLYRAVPTLGVLMGIGEIIAEYYKIAAASFALSGLIVYQDIKRINAG